MTMVERVARRLCLLNGGKPDDKVIPHRMPQGPKPCTFILTGAKEIPAWMLFEREARAAIEEMREPSDAMLEAAYARDDPGGMFGGDGPVSHEGAWQVMIDEALK